MLCLFLLFDLSKDLFNEVFFILLLLYLFTSGYFNFEFGTFIGLFHQISRSKFRTSLFFGGYGSVYVGDAFLAYSLSDYTPRVSSDGTSISVNDITTHYITLGYHITKSFEVTAGAIGSNVGTQWHWAGSMGVGYYLF